MENTKTELRVIAGLTETGRVKAAVRDSLKAQVEANLLKDWTAESDGSFSFPLVSDTTGKVIKARIQMTITAQEEFAVRGSKKKEVEVVEVPDLF